MRLAGVDLAWHGEKNSSAIAIGRINENHLQIEALEPAIVSLPRIIELLSTTHELSGVAIDAPLIIKNYVGQRSCERALSHDYGSRKASCHTSNMTLYPEALSVRLSSKLREVGFNHMASDKWQIECYPHPAIIECFGLPERLAYKKGRVADRKSGQIALASLILSLEQSPVLAIKIPQHVKLLLSQSYIASLKGRELKANEDALDSMICLYIAALYHTKAGGVTYGNRNEGYIWVPKIKCV